MLFPKGRALHSNLDSLFVRLEALMLILETKLFTGCISVSSAGYEGVLIYYKGRLSSALDDYGGVKSIGGEARQQILAKGKEKGSTISVYAMPRNTTAHLLNMGHLQLLYKDLSSDFADINSLVEKLIQDGAPGCIDVTALNQQWNGIVFVAPNQMDASFLYHEGKAITGASVLREIGPLVSNTGAVFNVFSTRGKLKQPLRSATKRSATNPAINRGINQAPSINRVIDQALSPEQLVAVWGDIIGTIEKTVQPYVKKGFSLTFKTVLKEISVVYPFLHPISGGFYYENGKASYRGPADRLSEALGKSLDASVSRLNAETRKVNITVLVKSALQPLLQKHEDIIRRFSLVKYCELFNMTLYDRVVVAARPFFGENTDRFLERQWLNKVGATRESLTPQDITALIMQLEKSAMLLISKDEVRQLCQQVEFIQNSY